jgi:hypothetical protein
MTGMLVALGIVAWLVIGYRLFTRPNDLPCADCGHTYAPGGRRHEYDHREVQPVCTTCHHARERARANGQGGHRDHRPHLDGRAWDGMPEAATA